MNLNTYNISHWNHSTSIHRLLLILINFHPVSQPIDPYASNRVCDLNTYPDLLRFETDNLERKVVFDTFYCFSEYISNSCFWSKEFSGDYCEILRERNIIRSFWVENIIDVMICKSLTFCELSIILKSRLLIYWHCPT